MSSEDNKQVVRRFYDEVMGAGRVEVLDEVMVEDFIDHGEALFGSPRGRETLRQSIGAVHGILPGLYVSLHEIIAEGDLVGVRGTMRCRHGGNFLGVAGTGHELSWEGIAIFRLAAGRIAERWFNSDSISIFRQLGLAPSGAAAVSELG
ncbi:ester cyclase [Candidatus Thiosymbion oneisti]|uniref:ester cyclase n=1 Tax=Candidatus Thiosymbion oneisti TaxID=589554 RepID=UPI000B7CFBA9|nr:ester cyclase [Candidatus Thiosymbion oneisti]